MPLMTASVTASQSRKRSVAEVYGAATHRQPSNIAKRCKSAGASDSEGDSD